jgi:predicted acylesterase/phospholipase RssA
MLRDRTAVFTRLLHARVGRLSQIFARGHVNPVLIDGEKFLDLFWPQSVPERFEDLAVPLLVVATDYYARSEVVIGSGALVSAVAGSMAIPGLVRPVVLGGRVLIDGGATNPLPFDHLLPRADLVIAVDVVGGAARETDGVRRLAHHAGGHRRGQTRLRPAAHHGAARGRHLPRARLLQGKGNPRCRRPFKGRAQARYRCRVRDACLRDQAARQVTTTFVPMRTRL